LTMEPGIGFGWVSVMPYMCSLSECVKDGDGQHCTNGRRPQT
jgi:hypothetical protein